MRRARRVVRIVHFHANARPRRLARTALYTIQTAARPVWCRFAVASRDHGCRSSHRGAPRRRPVTTALRRFDFRCTGVARGPRLFRVCNELSSVYFACIRIPQGKHAKRSIIVGTRNPHSWPVHLNSLFSSGARAPRRPPRPPTCNTHTHAVAVRAAPLDWHLSEPRGAHNAKP